MEDQVVTIDKIPSFRPPIKGEKPQKYFASSQYEGPATWFADNVELTEDARFEAGKVYRAEIVLTANDGYTFEGITENFFEVARADSVTNSENSGEVTVQFPKINYKVVTESNVSNASAVGMAGTITADSVYARIIYVKADSSEITFPQEVAETSYGQVTSRFFMSKTEVTNVIMVKVLQWALDNGKFSFNVNDHNGLNPLRVKHGDQVLLYIGNAYSKIRYDMQNFNFYVENGYEDYPVVMITWYGTIMFCNWLTEMRDGNTNNVVYTNITSNWDHNDTENNNNKTGYRLPLYDEWEYCARYIGTNPPTVPTGTITPNLATAYIAKDHNGGHPYLTGGYYWTPGSYASGAIRDYRDVEKTRAVGWYYGDPDMGLSSRLMPVKQKVPNQLGLYDMSGNVQEWTFDVWWNNNKNRRIGSGGYTYNNAAMQVGYFANRSADWDNEGTGFRFARTK